ncbi:MAG: hypothetical protein ACD_41C00343G0004 [uncultured bacterium]|nr:MAG: hypothetical protein ACD_41C00343G0004 [uncultured bacterium]
MGVVGLVPALIVADVFSLLVVVLFNHFALFVVVCSDFDEDCDQCYAECEAFEEGDIGQQTTHRTDDVPGDDTKSHSHEQDVPKREHNDPLAD